MSRTARATMAAVILAAGMCGASRADEPHRRLLTGSDDAVWLVRDDVQARTFDAVARELGGKWEWIVHDVTGEVAAAACVERYLHVLFRSGAYRVYNLGGGDGTAGLSLPGEPIVACEARDVGGSSGRGIVAVVALDQPAPSAAAAPSDTAPATSTAPAVTTRPATAPAGMHAAGLGVFHNIDGAWTRLTSLPSNLTGSPDELILGATPGAVHVLTAGRRGAPAVVHTWRGGAWRSEVLDDAAAGLDPVAAIGLDGTLMIVLATPADEEGRRRMRLWFRGDTDAATLTPIIRQTDVPATFPVGSLPAVTRLGDKLALLWREDDTLRFATCEPSGRLSPKGDVTVFTDPPVEGNPQDILSNFTWGALIAVLIALLILRPRTMPQRFELPDHLAPAPIWKRLAAGLIDLLPWQMVVTAVLMPRDLPTDDFAAVLEWSQNAPETAYIWIISISAYVVYCIVMEYRFGATAGKMLLRMRTVGAGGRRCGLRGAVLRNLLKAFELNPMWIPLLIVAVLTRYRQRLGDMIARTTVIDLTRSRPAPPPQQEQPPQEREPRH